MSALLEQLDHTLPFGLTGHITRIVGLTIEARGLPAPVGAVCRIDCDRDRSIHAEVVGFRGSDSVLLPHGPVQGIKPGNTVALVQSTQSVRVGERLLGRVIDGRGRCIDGRPQPALSHRRRLQADAPAPLERPRIDTPLETGIRALDGFLTCGLGQRLGVFSGSGVGKSTLLGQLARSSSADVNVIVLVGERGREVREFLERDLGPDGQARSVVVVATSDEPAVIRLRAAYVATAIAEYFRDGGNDVLFLMDSVTRVVLAQREIGLASGEPPATRGFPPSAFAILPGLLERSGRNERGSITGIYSVLVEADDANEPISDSVRGILDGHLVLSRDLAERSHWPAIDVLGSISRSMPDVVSDDHLRAAQSLRQSLAAYRDAEDLINIGAYQTGSDRRVDVAIQLREPLERFLQQGTREYATLTDTVDELKKLQMQKSELENTRATPASAPAT